MVKWIFFFNYGFKKLTRYEKIKYTNELREEIINEFSMDSELCVNF